MLELGDSKYIPGSYITQAYVAAYNLPQVYYDEDYIPVGCDLYISRNVSKEKAVYMKNNEILEVLFFNGTAVGMKIYGKKVSARSIDIQMDSMLEHISDCNGSIYSSANSRSRRVIELFGNHLPDGVVNAITTPSHGVPITDTLLVRDPTVKIDMTQYPYNYIDSHTVDPWLIDAAYEDARFQNCTSWVKKYLQTIPEMKPEESDIRLETSPTHPLHRVLLHLIIKMYESKYTDIHIKYSSKEGIEFYGCNPMLGIVSTRDTEEFLAELHSTFSRIPHTEVLIHKTFREEGVVTIQHKGFKSLFYFDIGMHLLCRCGIEETVYNKKDYDYDREKFDPYPSAHWPYN